MWLGEIALDTIDSEPILCALVMKYQGDGTKIGTWVNLGVKGMVWPYYLLAT